MTKRAIAAFAHPDDETFSVGGTLARAVSLGWHVTVICATRGEVGEIGPGTNATPQTLGAVRERELRAACAALGVTDVRLLGYRDSGMDGTPENKDGRAYVNAPADEVIGTLVALFREDPPAVVFTFDASGIYGHPDHKAIHRHATAAFDRAAAPDARLLYTAIPKSVAKIIGEQLRAAGVQDGPPGDFGVPDEEVDIRADVRAFAEPKRRAVAAHATQVQEWQAHVSEEQRIKLLSTEYFHVARGSKPRGDDPLA
ncbi:MAG TPA: PIG-L family deacetylase [Candidatus Limnocylindria bacterium]|nr:PIG-L family deacetylase [Candidatus Limnocylindria bacterium]